MSEITAEVIIENPTEGEAKCPGCGCRVTSRYRADYEAKEQAVCGDCFACWLVDENHKIEVSD